MFLLFCSRQIDSQQRQLNQIAKGRRQVVARVESSFGEVHDNMTVGVGLESFRKDWEVKCPN
jgi:hypothetical protein